MKTREWYQQTAKQALEAMGSDRQGLSVLRAEELLEEKGENVLKEGKKKSVLQVFLSQFADLLVVILILAAVLSMVSGNVESTIVILAVITLNAVLGTVQHVKAEKSLDSLKSLSSPNAKVMRGGRRIEIPSKMVVPGDILLLEAGDLVAADGRILENFSLQVNESVLTGESTNVDKTSAPIEGEAPLADRTNMVYSGSLVTYGRAAVLVTETGMETEIGKIAALMNSTKEKKTPLQVSLDQFSSRLAVVIMVICALVFALSLYRRMPVLDSLMFAVALAVAAIPEALSSIVTIVQAMGTQKMAKEQAIIKELPFDSDRKLMTTKYRLRGIPTILTKGAVDVLLDRTAEIRTSEGIRPLTDRDRREILEKINSFRRMASASWPLPTGRWTKRMPWIWETREITFSLDWCP